jgi:hypothetical protein
MALSTRRPLTVAGISKGQHQIFNQRLLGLALTAAMVRQVKLHVEAQPLRL